MILEPSFSHFLIYRLGGEEVIADKGMFYCGQGSLDVGSAVQKNVSSALFGGEGLFQTRIRGTGIVVLESPVPADEVLQIDLKDDTLQVDGSFALMRTGKIEFSVEKSTRSLLGTITSGEGLIQTFRGIGVADPDSVGLSAAPSEWDAFGGGDDDFAWAVVPFPVKRCGRYRVLLPLACIVACSLVFSL